MRKIWLHRARLESLALQHQESASGVIRIQKAVNRDYGHYFADLPNERHASEKASLARAGGLQLGRGFHSLSGLICKSPFAVVEFESNVQSPPRLQYELRTVHSESGLFEVLDLDPATSFSGFGVWATDKVKWAKERRINHYCVYLIAKLKVTCRTDYLSQLELEPSAQALLKSTYGCKEFYQTYGNTFISACQEGGEIIALFEFDTNSPSHQEHMRNALEAIAGSWDAYEPFEESLRAFCEEGAPRLHLFVNGADESLVHANHERILKLFSDFPSWVSQDGGKSSRFGVYCQDYASVFDEVGLVQSPWDKAQVQYDQLAAYADRISMMVHDIEYINNHHEFFSQNEYVKCLSPLQQMYHEVQDCASLTAETPDNSSMLPAGIAEKVHDIEFIRPQQNLLEKAPIVGLREGDVFDDVKDVSIRQSNFPRYITVHESAKGLGLGIYYQMKTGPDYIGPVHGIEVENPHGFSLGSKEHLVEVSGSFDPDSEPAIKTLSMRTNLGRTFGSFGKATDGAKPFRFNVLEERKILGFQGFSKLGLNALAPIYGPLQLIQPVRGGEVLGGLKGHCFGGEEDEIIHSKVKQVKIKASPMTLDMREMNKIGQLKFSIISSVDFSYEKQDGTLFSTEGTESGPGIEIFLDHDEYIKELSGAWLHFPVSFPLVEKALSAAMGEEMLSDYLLAYVGVRTNKRSLHDLGSSVSISASLRHIMKKRTFSFIAPPGFEIIGIKGRATSAITAMGPIYRMLTSL